MRRNVVLAGTAILAVMVALVLFVHGTDEQGLRAAIRATARTSALCTALAFARFRVREASALVPVSHTLHYALILATSRVLDAPTVLVGVAVFAVMVWNAIRPNAIAIYILWISFLVGMLRPGALYVMFVTLLLCAGIARWMRRPRLVARATTQIGCEGSNRVGRPLKSVGKALESSSASTQIDGENTRIEWCNHPNR